MSCRAKKRPTRTLTILSAIASLALLVPATRSSAENNPATPKATWSPVNESLAATPGSTTAGLSISPGTRLQVISASTSRSLRGLRWQPGDKFEGVDVSASLGRSLSVHSFAASTSLKSVTDDGPASLFSDDSRRTRVGLQLSGQRPFTETIASGWSMAELGGGAEYGLASAGSSNRVSRHQMTFQSGSLSLSADLSTVGKNFRAPRSKEGLAALKAQDFGYSLGARKGTSRRAFSANFKPGQGLGLSLQSESLSGAGNRLERAQYGFQSKNLSFSISRLNVEKLTSKQLGKEFVGKLNKDLAGRAKLGAAHDPLLRAANAKALTGLKQQDYALSTNFGGGLKLTADGNELRFGTGHMTARDEHLSFNGFQLHHRVREVDRGTNAKALTALGHKALAKQIGHASEEWTANWQASSRLSLQHYRKKDVLDKGGAGDANLVTRVTRNNLVWNPDSSLHITALQQEVKSGLVSGNGAQTTTQTRAFSLSKQFSKTTSLALSRNTTSTRSADKRIDTSRTRIQFKTAQGDRFRLAADIDRRQHSRQGSTKITKAQVAFKPSSRMGLQARLNRFASDARGSKEDLNYGLTYNLGGGRTLAAGLHTTKQSAKGNLNTSKTLSLSLKPVKNTTLTLTDSDRCQNGNSSSFQRLDLRTQLGKATSLTLRSDRHSAASGTSLRTNTLFLTTKRGPYTLQLGRKSVSGGKGDATFYQFNAEPFKGTKLSLGYAGRQQGNRTIAMRNWSFSTQLGSVQLTGSHVYNRAKDKKGDAILPLAKAFDPISVETFGLKTRLNARWSLAAGYSLNENLKSGLQVREHSLTFATIGKTRYATQIKIRSGVRSLSGTDQHYTVYEISRSWNISSDRQVRLTARKIHGDGVQLFPGGHFEAQLSGQWSF